MPFRIVETIAEMYTCKNVLNTYVWNWEYWHNENEWNFIALDTIFNVSDGVLIAICHKFGRLSQVISHVICIVALQAEH